MNQKHNFLITNTYKNKVLCNFQICLTGVKRKISVDAKKKKKTKSGGEKKESRKRIKVEPEDNDKHNVPKSASISSNKEMSDSQNVLDDGDDSSSVKSHNQTSAELKRKEKRDLKSSEELAKERKVSSSSSKSYKQIEETSNSAEDAFEKNKSK